MSAYHATCPVSEKKVSRPTIIGLRRLLIAAMAECGCQGPVKLYQGRQYMGQMWTDAKHFYYRANGGKTVHILNRSGDIMRR